MDSRRFSAQAWLAGTSASINPSETSETIGDNFAVLAGLGWLDKVHQITHQNLPQKNGDNFALRNALG